MDGYQSIKHGISALETSDTDATGNKPFHMRLRSSTSQAKARQLALQCQDSPEQQFEAASQYNGAVEKDKKKTPASSWVPNMYAQAIASPQAEEWEAGMHKKLKSLDEHEAADLIPFIKVPRGCSIIGTRWVTRVKTDGRFKERIVVQGWAQQHGLDCFTTFAPVCRIASQRLLLAVAPSRDWRVLAMDVQTAFLNGKLEEDVYTKQTPGFETIDERTNRPLVMKLRKSLHGIRQSLSVWNRTIDKDLRKMGFTPTASDSCVYTMGSRNTYIMLTLFVNNPFMTGPSNASMAEVERLLMEKFAMTDLGNVSQILGIEVKRDKAAGAIKLSQEQDTLSVLKRFNMSDCNPVPVPGIGKELSAQLEGRVLLNETMTKLYQAIVGSLIFLTQCTRYDVAFSTMKAARHMAKPTTVHMAAVKRILRYLRGTHNLAIVYKRGSSFDLTGYCDASYGMGDPKNMRFTTGSMLFSAGGLTNFSSQLQKITAQSATEAEVIALNTLNTCAKNRLSLSGILGELGWPNFRSFRISSDNRGAFLLSANGNYSNRSKHIAIRFSTLRHWITDRIVITEYVCSKISLLISSPNVAISQPSTSSARRLTTSARRTPSKLQHLEVATTAPVCTAAIDHRDCLVNYLRQPP